MRNTKATKEATKETTATRGWVLTRFGGQHTQRVEVQPFGLASPRLEWMVCFKLAADLLATGDLVLYPSDSCRFEVEASGVAHEHGRGSAAKLAVRIDSNVTRAAVQLAALNDRLAQILGPMTPGKQSAADDVYASKKARYWLANAEGR